MKKKSKRYREILKTAIKDKKAAVKDIIDMVKKNSTTKFDESIDVSLKINLKQREQLPGLLTNVSDISFHLCDIQMQFFLLHTLF